jgi:corrinoid protein of di/trimethylamine methyltransferase
MDRLRRLVEYIQNGEAGKAVQEAEAIVKGNEYDLDQVLKAMTQGIREVGDRFERLEIFVPEVIFVGEAMAATMEVLKPKLEERKINTHRGSVIFGTARGDAHDIGKNIVIMVLRANGYTVYDLGINIDSLEFIKKAEELRADIIAISSLMTTTMPGQKEVIDFLREKGIRERYKVIIGGAPTSQKWADGIGADGWAEDASQALDLVETIMKKEKIG